MQTREFLAELDGVQRAVSLYRLGVVAGGVEFAATRLTQPEGARRAYLRGVDAGAGELLQRLVERGGEPLARDERFEDDAARLRGWFPLMRDRETWSLPRDFALALLPVAEHEAFFATSLVARLRSAGHGALASSLGLPTNLSASGISKLATALVARRAGPSLQAAAAETARLVRLRASEIVDVTIDPATAAFTLRLRDDRTLVVACREHAMQLGLTFEDESQPKRRRVSGAARAVRTPVSVRAGALVTFSTVRAADDALREPDFRAIVLHRLDERNVIIRPDAAAEPAARMLQRMGFALTELAVGA